MCTLTWWRHAAKGDYGVHFNRDEKRSRSRATPPELHHEDHGSPWLAPIDPDGGGTWMFANPHGLLVALLNRWQEEDPHASSPRKSRGQLMRSLATHPNVPTLSKALKSTDLQDYPPFTLFAIDALEVTVHRWSQGTLTPLTPPSPAILTSSSYQSTHILPWRERLLSEHLAQGHPLEDFHALSPQELTTLTPSEEPHPGAYAIRMNRHDAQTWSRSHLRVENQRIHWDYWEEFAHLQKRPQLHQITCKQSPPPAVHQTS